MRKDICMLCAWRENCQKKFSVSGRDVRCPDFVRDLAIKDDGGGVKEEKTGEQR
jgi:hypothetical protein